MDSTNPKLTSHAMRYALCALLTFLFRFPVSLLIALCPMPYTLCVPIVPALAAGPTAGIVAKIQQKYDQTYSLKADFVQKTRSRAASFGTSASGTLFFLKPRAIRWDYEQPEQQFVINEDKAWLYVPGEMTIYLYDAEQIINSPVVLSFFSGLGQLREMFSVTQLPSELGPPVRYRLELLPREPDSPVSRVILWIEPESYHVMRVETEDPLGNINEITLSNIEVNTELDPSFFAFKVPEGVTLESQEFTPPK